MHVVFYFYGVVTYHMQINKYGSQLKLLYLVLSSDSLIYGFLTYFSPIFHFYSTWKRQKFLIFRGYKVEHWAEMRWVNSNEIGSLNHRLYYTKIGLIDFFFFFWDFIDTIHTFNARNFVGWRVAAIIEMTLRELKIQNAMKWRVNSKRKREENKGRWASNIVLVI